MPRYLRIPGIPVFVYHGLADETARPVAAREERYSVSVQQFQTQLDCLDGADFTIVLLSNLMSGKASLLGRSQVVLTFDDGRASDFSSAYPRLREKGFNAEFFVNTATINTAGFLTWSEAKEMQREGMSFQSHGHDHVDLTRLSGDELLRQLKLSKETLEDQLGAPVNFLAAPFGALNSTVVECALRLGYQAVCSARTLPARPGAHNLNRVVIYRGTSIRAFRQLLQCRPWGYLGRIAQSPFYRARNLLGRLRPMRPGPQVPEKTT
jgi:peptidoglycan/xylan/chitin deacetylase (PgdA/CDA1 family)